MAGGQVFSKASSVLVKDLRSAKSEWSARLLKRPAATAMGLSRRMAATAAGPKPAQNVVGIGIGEKVSLGKPTGALALKFFVKVKYPDREISPSDRLPKVLGGLPTDVEVAGVFRALQPRGADGGAGRGRRRAPAPASEQVPDPRVHRRPAQPGCSVGYRVPGDATVMAGTFGALVRVTKGEVYILSNNHVLADEGRLAAGAPVFQPGLLDGGDVATDQVAELTRFEPLDGARVDAAIARVLRRADVSAEVLMIGRPAGVGAASNDMIVHKFGRTTSYTAGRVTSVNTDVTVEYDTGNFFFEDQIIIRGLNGSSFSKSGDSGSLILERSTGTAVALLFAGSASHTIANHIKEVLRLMKVQLGG